MSRAAGGSVKDFCAQGGRHLVARRRQANREMDARFHACKGDLRRALLFGVYVDAE